MDKTKSWIWWEICEINRLLINNKDCYMNLEQISDSQNNKQSNKISSADGIDDVSEIAIDSLPIPDVKTTTTSTSILDSTLDAVGAVIDGIFS